MSTFYLSYGSRTFHFMLLRNVNLGSSDNHNTTVTDSSGIIVHTYSWITKIAICTDPQSDKRIQIHPDPQSDKRIQIHPDPNSQTLLKINTYTVLCVHVYCWPQLGCSIDMKNTQWVTQAESIFRYFILQWEIGWSLWRRSLLKYTWISGNR